LSCLYGCGCSMFSKGWPISPHDAHQKFQWLTLLKSFNILINFPWYNAPHDLSNLLLLNESKCCWNVHYIFVHCIFLLVLITLMFIAVLCFAHHLIFVFYPLRVFITVLCWCSLFWCMLWSFASGHHLYVHHIILLCSSPWCSLP
jgi:hypothetical protein